MEDVEGELRHSFSKIQVNDKYFDEKIDKHRNSDPLKNANRYLAIMLVLILIANSFDSVISDYIPLITILGIVGVLVHTYKKWKNTPKKIVLTISFNALKSNLDLTKELQQNMRRWLNEKNISEIGVKERDGNFDSLVYLTYFAGEVLVFELIGSEEETQKIVDELYDINYTSLENRETTSDLDFNEVRFKAYYSRNKVVLTDHPELRSIPGILPKKLMMIFLGIWILIIGINIPLNLITSGEIFDFQDTLLIQIFDSPLIRQMFVAEIALNFFVYFIVISISRQFFPFTHRKMKVYIHSPNAHYGMEYILRKKFEDFGSLKMKNYCIYSTENLIFFWKGFTKKDLFELQIHVPRWQKFSLEELIGEGVDFPLFSAYKSKTLGIKDHGTLSQAIKTEKRIYQKTQWRKERELQYNSSLSHEGSYILIGMILFFLFLGGMFLSSPDANYQNQYLQYETSGIGSEVNSVIDIPARTLVRYQLTISNGNDSKAIYTATGELVFETSIGINYNSRYIYRNTTSDTRSSEIFTEKGFVFSLRINGNTTNSLKIYYGQEFRLNPFLGPIAIFSILGVLDMMALSSMNEIGYVNYQRYRKSTSETVRTLKLPYEQHRVDADFIDSDPRVENKKSKLWKISLAMTIIYSSVLFAMNLLSTLFPDGMYMYTHLILESNMWFWYGLLFIFYLPVPILGAKFDDNRSFLTKFSIVFTIQIVAIIVIHPLMWKYLKYLYF